MLDSVITDDNVRSETKNLIEERAELKRRGGHFAVETIRITKLNKLIKKKIEEDIKCYGNELTTDIIRDNYSQ